MKKLFTIMLLILFAGAPAFSQGGLIGLYVDPWGNECDIQDNGYGIIDVYVVHKLAPGVTAAQFKIQASSGFTGIYLGQELVLPRSTFFGDSQRSLAVAFADCYTCPVHFLTVRYILLGTSPPNSYLEVVADPDAHPPGIYMTDCNMPIPNLYPALGGRAYINNDGSATCTITPTEPTTWGQIKSLYGN